MRAGNRSRSSRLARAAVLMVLAGVLSGCSALGIAGPRSSPAATPVPTSTPALAVDCASVVSEADLAALLGAGAKATSASPGVFLVAAVGPLSVPAAGGATCDWVDGNASLDVELLPHAAESWATLAREYPQTATPGADYDGGVSLGGDCAITTTSASCHTNILVDGAWLSVVLRGVPGSGLTEAGFHGVVQRMIPAVLAAVSTAPAAQAGAAFDCAADELRAEVQQTFARPDATETNTGGMFAIASAVPLSAGAALCQFRVGADDRSAYLGSLSILPLGSAVFETFRQAALAADPTAHSDTLTVHGASVPALVWGGQDEGVSFSSVDALIGRTWLEFRSADLGTDRSLALLQWVAGRL
ncbi:hypothetical protein [Leifsonia sp. EB34]|uniref:hypothetical protein n=1 Tax=Leifsonia sp. EB34 TaxID=3156303 RepID=UPI003516D862